MAYFHTNVLDEQIKALPTVDTASGSVATFETDMTENLISCVAEIVATQSGSGDPSPSNPRPITGYSTETITANGNTYSSLLGVTVYNGYHDYLKGNVVRTYKEVEMSTLNWGYSSQNNWFQVSKPSDAKAVNNMGLLCSCYYNNGTATSRDFSIFQTANNLRVRDINYTDPTDFINSLVGQYIVYELDEPIITYTVIGNDIQTIMGINTISSNRGDMKEVKYFLTVGKAIS